MQGSNPIQPVVFQYRQALAQSQCRGLFLQPHPEPRHEKLASTRCCTHPGLPEHRCICHRGQQIHHRSRSAGCTGRLVQSAGGHQPDRREKRSGSGQSTGRKSHRRRLRLPDGCRAVQAHADRGAANLSHHPRRRFGLFRGRRQQLSKRHRLCPQGLDPVPGQECRCFHHRRFGHQHGQRHDHQQVGCRDHGGQNLEIRERRCRQPAHRGAPLFAALRRQLMKAV